MSTFKLTPLAAAITLVLPVLYLSTTHAIAQSTKLPQVTVNAIRSNPLPGGEALDANGLASGAAATSDSASLLRDVPGLSLYGAGGVSSLPAIHGLADDRLRIKVDGMDLIASCPNHMNPALSYIDPSSVGSIKVFTGVTPVSTGGDSIGGTILVEAKPPTFAAPGAGSITQGEIGVFYRSNNKARGVNLGATFATETLSISYQGATSQADNYTAAADFKRYDFTGRLGHNLPRDAVGSSAYETRNHLLGLAYRQGNHLFEAKLGLQDMPYQLYPNQRMDMLANDQTRINLRYLGEFDWGNLELRGYRERVDHFMDFGGDKRYWYGNATPPAGSGGPTALFGTPCSPISATCAAGMPMVTEGKTTGISARADVTLSPQDLLRLGGEMQQYRINDGWPPSGAGMMPGTFWNIRDGQRDRSALYAEWEARKSAQWLTLVGARVERVTMDAGTAVGYNPAGMGFQARDAAAFNAQNHASTDNNLDLSAMARYTASPSYDIEFGYAHKLRSPNVYERFPWSTWQMAALMNNFVGDGNGYIGNLTLKPEKANTVSASFDWHASDQRWGFKASPYFTQVSDFIDAQQWNATTNAPATTLVKDKFSVLKYVNQSARLYGIDLSGHMPLTRSAAGDFGLRGLLSYTHGENRDTGDGLYQIMPLNAKLALTHKLGRWDNSLELVAVKAKTTVSAMRNEIRTPGYGLVNLRASSTWGQVRLDFGVENLLDKFYDLPTGGAYTGQGTTMSNPALPNYPQWGTAVPGMGRTIYVGVNVKF